MKNLIVGMAALLLALTLAGCGDYEDVNIVETVWIGHVQRSEGQDAVVVTFTDKTYHIVYAQAGDVDLGVYAISGNTITLHFARETLKGNISSNTIMASSTSPIGVAGISSLSLTRR